MSSGDSSTSVISTFISGDGGSKWQVVIALLASSVGFIVAVVNSIAAYFRDRKHMEELAAQERRFEAFKKELEDKQRRLVRFENVQELMKQYKKPLLQSAFDLQSRLANQVKTNFLYHFAQRANPRDLEYARLNMAFVISEFLGWLEVIRQEIVFIVGDGNRTSDLNLIIDAIKFQFTGETPFQGKGAEPHWQIMQLYAGELRAIGEVMITERSYDDDNVGSNLSVIGYAEFVRRQTMEPPDPSCSSQEEIVAWKKSKEKLQRDILSPLLSYIDQLMTKDNDSTPRLRLTILQVLLCKLIDVLDDTVPYELGNEYDLEGGEEPRYIPRDFRLTPLVKYLSKPQLKWLSETRFMKVMEVDRHAWEDWYSRLCLLPEEDQDIYTRLSFPGFREDLHKDRDGRLISQKAREARLGNDAFPGAFPPLQKRHRESWWWAALSDSDYKRWYREALAKGIPVQGIPHKSGSIRRDAAKPPGNTHWGFLRNRKSASVNAVKPTPRTEDTAANSQPAILIVPSAHQLRVNGGSGRTDSSDQRTPVAPIAINPRGPAGLS